MTALLALVGPTASGKSDIALVLAEELGAEIVSVDSMQVYRGMDIGTAKPTLADRRRVPHHLIDLVDPEEEFTVAQFQRAGLAAMGEIEERGHVALVVGGSGLHLRALVDPLEFPPTDRELRARLETLDPAEAVTRLLAADPEASHHIDLANPRRVIRAIEVYELTGRTPSQRAATVGAAAVRRYEPRRPVRVVGIDPAGALRARIEARVIAMHEAGLLVEVAQLRSRLGRTARQALNYKELLPVLDGTATQQEALAAQVRNTHAFARRQRTFLRRDPRITWLPWHDDSVARLDAARRAFEEVPTWTS